MGDLIIDNAYKLNIDKLRGLLFKKGFSVEKFYDTYRIRRRAFLRAWKDEFNYAFIFRDWSQDIELRERNMAAYLFITPTMAQDIVTVSMLVKECWNGNS